MALAFTAPQIAATRITPLDVEESYSLGNVSTKDFFITAFGASDRFRPLYNFQRYLWANLFGYNSRPYYLTYALMLGITIYTVSVIAKIKSFTEYFLLSAIILLSPPTVDNYWRLGTAEPLFALTFAVLILLADSKRLILPLAVFIVFLLSKESAVFFAAPFIIYFFLRKDMKKLSGFLLISILYLGLLLPRYLNTQQTRYMSQFVFSSQKSLEVISEYINRDWYIAILLSVSSLLYLLNSLNSSSKKLTLSFLIFVHAIISFIPLLLKWQHYYLFPTMLLICILFFREINQNILLKYKRIIFPALLAGLLFWSSETFKIGFHWHTKQIFDSALTEYLLEERSKNPELVYLFDNPSLHNISGSWMITTDFGRINKNYYPDTFTAWAAYEESGLSGIDAISDKARNNFIKFPDNSLLITNECTIKDQASYKIDMLCADDFLPPKERCGWCVVSK